MQQRTLALDELEIAIQLVQIENPDLKKAPYAVLAKEIEEQFKVKVDESDIFLLYEPTIEQDQEDIEVFYGSMFNIHRDGQYY